MSRKPLGIDTDIEKLPFQRLKVPVCQGVVEFQALSERYPSYSVCPYLAYKDEEGWNKSTSRVYMNQVLPGFLYVPVNIQKDDSAALIELFSAIRDDQRVVAANITQPHKSNPILMEEFAQMENRPVNIDTLIRNQDGKLVPYDLNAPSFMSWYSDEVGSMEGKTIVLVGVGGVGEPISRRLAESNPAQLILVDPNEKSDVIKKLQSLTPALYKPNIQEVGAVRNENGVVVINAAGKEAAAPDSGLHEWLEQNAVKNGVFVDLRPHLDIEIVEVAKKIGWQSHTGYGMNARNDYSLLMGIAKVMCSTAPSFEEFKTYVASAS